MPPLSAMELLALASSLSLLAGWRLYATIFAVGLAQKLGWWVPPEHVQSLALFSRDWVLVASGVGVVAEFFADKVPWIDSLWDAVHTVVRPLGGVLVALTVVDPSNTMMQILVFLLGGGAALLSHGAKAGARVAINASPEPFSNIGMSLAEDATSAGGLWLALTYPWAALGLVLTALAMMAALALIGWRLVRWLARPKENPGQG